MGRRKEIEQFVSRKLQYLAASSDRGEGTGMLAVLRKGIGRKPGEKPELLGILLTDMPEDFMSVNTEPTREEWACYTALTLYAMCQQGRDPEKENADATEGADLGAAMAEYVRLSEDGNAQRRMAKKLQTLSTSKDMEEFSYHLRSIIKLLKSKDIAINYPKLAGDLYEYQFPESRTGIFLKWGQDFYRNTHSEKITEEENDE